MNLIAFLSHDKHKQKVYPTIWDWKSPAEAGIFKSRKSEIPNNICHVSVHRPKHSLLPVIQEWIDLQYLYLIDAMTKTIQDEPGPKINGAYISSPMAFDEICDQVDRLLVSQRFGAFIFNFLRTITAYRTEEEVRRFVNRMLARVSMAPWEGIFICVEPSVKSWFIEELHKMADRVVRFE